MEKSMRFWYIIPEQDSFEFECPYGVLKGQCNCSEIDCEMCDDLVPCDYGMHKDSYDENKNG